MDVPYAIQQYLLSNGPLTAVTGAGDTTTGSHGIYLLELGAKPDGTIDPTISSQMPFQCAVVRATGGPAIHGSGTLQLNDQHLNIVSYGQTPHLAYNVDSMIYQLLKYLKPSVWASTYLHWVRPVTRPIQLRDPTTEWPYVVSVWQSLASDVTITAA